MVHWGRKDCQLYPEGGDHFLRLIKMMVFKVMGLDRLDSIPSEEEMDREDSGEN